MSAAKDKGTKAETALVRYLRAEGFVRAKRILQEGVAKPDVEVFPGFVVQVKDWQTMALAGWVDAAMAQTSAYGARYGVVWHHRKGRGNPADWYVTMPGWMYVAHLKAMTR